MGILYYVIYNPLRKTKNPLEVYQLNNGEYELVKNEPVWLAEIGLGIGREMGNYQGINREWLYWYDEQGKRYLTPEEQIKREREEGERRGQQVLILRQLNLKVGYIPLKIEEKIKQLSSSQLNNLA